MSGSLSDSERAEPNLVPILDMVFQLITFFMLVVNFKTQAVDQVLVLPVIGSARPVEEENNSELLLLNIRSNGDVHVRGKAEPNFASFISFESQFIIKNKKLKPGDQIPVRIVVRGDRTLSVKTLLDVVDKCRANGFGQFDFVVTRTAGK